MDHEKEKFAKCGKMTHRNHGLIYGIHGKHGTTPGKWGPHMIKNGLICTEKMGWYGKTMGIGHTTQEKTVIQLEKVN